MTESPLLVFLLALIAFCAVVVAVSLLVTANSLWKTSHRLDLFLSHGDEAAREAHRILGSARQILARTNRAAASVEGVVERACGFVQNFFGRFGQPHRVRTGVHRIGSHVTNKRRVG